MYKCMFPFYHKITSRPGRLLCYVVFFFLMNTTAVAQQTGGLPDSVVVNDTIRSSEYIVQSVDSSPSNPSSEKNTEVDDRLISRIVPDSVVLLAKRDKDFEYANDTAYWKKKKEPKVETDFSFLRSKWLRVSIILLIGAILLFAFYKIVIENKMYLFYSSPKANSKDDEVKEVLAEEDLDEKITESLKANDLRSGIRFMYLKALKRAAEGGLIQFRQQATNQEYVREIKDPALRDQFRFLTGVFEQAWYGGFTFAPQRFETLKMQFELFYKSTGY